MQNALTPSATVPAAPSPTQTNNPLLQTAVVNSTPKPNIWTELATLNHFDPYQIYDVTIQADNKTYIVRFLDGTQKTVANPAYQGDATHTVYTITYVSGETWSNTNDNAKINPSIMDMGGFPSLPGQYTDPATGKQLVGDYVEWTKKKYGNSTDILGLNGAAADSAAHGAPVNWSVKYIGKAAIADPAQPTTTTQHTNAAPPTGTPNIGSGSTAAIINNSQCYPTPVYGRNPDGTMYIDHYIPCK